MPRILVYTIGYLVVIAGIAYAVYLMGVPAKWITAILIILTGCGLIQVSRKLKT